MTNGQNVLDQEILPRVFSSLDSVFPEFGWKRTRSGWVATNGRFTKQRLGARADRIVAKMQAGFLVHGDRSVHWLEYLAGGVFPRGPEWWTVVEALGARVGVALPAPARPSPRTRALELLSQALVQTPSIRAYVESRGSKMPIDVVVGELQEEPSQLLLSAGFSKRELEQTHIARDTRWANRVCCMWRDEHGRLSSMWGRTIADEKPKYLVLSGGAPALFGADTGFAAARKARSAHGVVVVEGMFDVLSLQARGFDQIVAVGRAGLSRDALRLLETVGAATLLLDADSAGRTGTVRAIEDWARSHSPVRLYVAELTGAKDPDELVRKQGISALEALLEQRMPAASAYSASKLAAATTPAQVQEVARQAVPFLAAVAVCHPIEAAAATELLTQRGINGPMLRMLSEQLSGEELLRLRESLAKRLSDVDMRLEAAQIHTAIQPRSGDCRRG